EEESHLTPKSDGRELLYKSISSKIARLNDASANPMQSLFYLGQDGVYAKLFAARSKSVIGMIGMLFKNVGECLALVDAHDPMLEGTKLAREHGTKYPIIQGPMANISDNADFAKMVLDAGCLPFFAMGNLPKNLAEKIISDGHEKVNSFGCGLIGLATNVKNFEEHLQLLKKYNVHYSLIAAGNAAQANDLEKNGVKCYLHCPSSQMLENAIKGGVKRFIFEGMEAGGHIGTLTSFVLWEVAMEKFLAQKPEDLADQRIIFAGGVGTKVASEFVSGMASVLAAKGAAVGISVGTTYLLTKEIVETGAIKPLYQKLLIDNDETTVIGATLGLSTRTVNGTYANRIIAKEYEMMREKVPLIERKHYFEAQNVGSLLIAAKAFSPNFEKLKAEKVLEYVYFDEKESLDKGNFHTGESLAFYKEQFTIDTVHSIFFGLKKGLKRNLDRLETIYGGRNTINDEIAIVGVGCLYPDAPDAETYWKNIIDKKYSIREIDPSRVNPDFYYSEDKKAEDKAYTKIAGVIDYYEFDRKKYGYSEDESKHISLSQKLVLDAAMQAVADAGYPEGKGLPKERTAVIVGTCLTNELNSDLQLRQYYPEFVYHLDQIPEFKALSEEDKEKVLDHFKKGISKGRLPKLPDGVALNVESARITKHLGVEGMNFTIDAACATSFAAIDAALKELLSCDSDVAVVGGVNTNHSPEAFVGFCKMGALSANGSYPFDERAGGFVLGEGAGVIVLKRMKDAIADGNKIYGVIKGVGASSDGKGRFIAAPSAEGQMYAIKRAYENMRAPINPDDVDYIEAHGTSTIAGDGTEIETIKGVYTGPRPKGVSSVKSQVGHLLGGAGNAGLIKVLLAMKNRTLPPNGQFKNLSPKLKLEGSPLYVIKDAAEWKVEQGRKRRAAVSSYGFGGINYHLVIEEYDGNYNKLPRMIFSNPDYDPNDDRIVITAVGTVLPGAQSADAFWANLESGKVTLSEPGAARFHNEYYAKEKDKVFNLPMFRMGIAKDYTINGLKYKIPPSAAKVIDRSQFFALDAASQVIAEAKLSGDLSNGNKIGLIFGTTASEKNCEQIVRTRVPFMESVLMSAPLDDATRKAIAGKFAESIRAVYHKNTEDTIPGLLANITTGRVANFFNMNGANFIVDAECASSAVALSLAVKDLRAGTSDYIIAGGVDTNLTPGVMQAFHMLKVLSRGGAKVYDKDSTGLCMSEGAALLGLTTLKHAKAKGMKIYGEITDFAFRSFPIENMIAPTEAGFIRTFNDLYAKAPVSRSQIRYVDGFASSNKVVDKWELTALNKAFRKGTFLGNVKPEIGYYRGANPAVVIAKLVLMAKNRTILPVNSYNAETTMLDGSGNIIAATSRINLGKNEPLAFAVDISGLGGIHGHGVVRTIPAWLEGASTGSVRASAFATLAVKSSSSATTAPSAAKGARICALLSGQGAQFPGMMKSLYASNPTVKKVFDRGEEIFRKERGYSILEMMFGND
ncbi:MAG TPA: beta-ketoacyl synthase N-terminal-like domain-containing protein, partial [Spirochaetota bacterium]|nr:beta-ketoacyl synthase N-terminal-like domain-containing protein [Spirochaetota bacterium]